MPRILLDRPYVDASSINKSVSHFQSIIVGNDDPELNFEATVQIVDIDILFVGYLILFKNEYPEIKITLSLPLNTDSGNDIDLIFKLRQYGVYAYLMSGYSVFTLNYGHEKPTTFDSGNYNQFPDGWFVLSKYFIVFLLITSKENNAFLFDLLFETPLSELTKFKLEVGPLGIKWETEAKSLYTKYAEAIIKTSNPKDRKGCIVNLGSLAFYRCLFDTKLICFYVDVLHRKNEKERRSDLRAGGLFVRTDRYGSKIYDAYEYYATLRPVLEELSSKPLIYSIVFSTLTRSSLLPSKLGRENKDYVQRQVLELWQFTKELVHGIKELAKNIYSHSSTRCGIVLARHISPEFIDLISNNEPQNFYSSCVSHLEKQGKSKFGLIDIKVFDLGEKGILETLHESTKVLRDTYSSSQTFCKLLDEDITLISSGALKLEHLLDSGFSLNLNQQSKRSIAHFGLLSFGKLIKENSGFLKISTFDKKKDRETVVIPKIDFEKNDEILYGTHFSVVLPINQNSGFHSFSSNSFGGYTFKHTFESSVEEILGIEALFDFEFKDLSGDDSFENASKTLFTYKFSSFVVYNRRDEYLIWKEVYDLLEKRYNAISKKYYLINLDFENVKLNSSQLLRFMGNWEICFPGLGLILSNIDCEKFHELKEININFISKNRELHFWNEDTPVIVYSYAKDFDKEIFYFTDVFWGKTEIDFLSANKVISRNHFNSVSLHDRANNKISLSPEFDSLHLKSNIAFLNKSILLPFDIILKSQSGRTFFESNSYVLFGNEII